MIGAANSVKDGDHLLGFSRSHGAGMRQTRRMSMRELTASEVESVSGGLPTVGRAVATWAIGKVLNAASKYIKEESSRRIPSPIPPTFKTYTGRDENRPGGFCRLV